MSLKKVELKFNDHTLIIDEQGNVYVKEISETAPVLAVDMYYCTHEGTTDDDNAGRSGKPAILLFDTERDDPRVIARYGNDSTTIEFPQE